MVTIIYIVVTLPVKYIFPPSEESAKVHPRLKSNREQVLLHAHVARPEIQMSLKMMHLLNHYQEAIVSLESKTGH